MTLAFHLAAVLVLMTLQTALRLHVTGLESCFDLLLVYVGYLGIFRKPREALPVVVLAGVGMDSLSGGGFGLFLSAYLWFFFLMNRVVRFLHRGNRLLLFSATAVGVIIENAVHLGTAVLVRSDFPVLQVIKDHSLEQLLWALLAGPFLLVMIYRLHRLWERSLSMILVRES